MELLRVSVENAALGGASKKYQSDPDRDRISFYV